MVVLKILYEEKQPIRFPQMKSGGHFNIWQDIFS